MPRVIRVELDTPVTVDAASTAFGSSLRLHLIRHYLAHPGSQREAAAALGVAATSVANNARRLIAAGVLIQEESEEDGRAHIYRVDEQRLAELIQAVQDFTAGPA